MAQIDILGIVDCLEREFRQALSDGIKESQFSMHTTNLDDEYSIYEHEIYRGFRDGLRKRCSKWESIDDEYIRP